MKCSSSKARSSVSLTLMESSLICIVLRVWLCCVQAQKKGISVLSHEPWLSSIFSLSWLYGFHACREPILHSQPASYPASIFKKYSHRHSQAGIIKRNHLFHFNRNTAVSAYWSIENITLFCLQTLWISFQPSQHLPSSRTNIL